MNSLTLIVNSSVLRTITDQLRALDVSGFTVCHVEGHGAHTAEDPLLSARDRVEGFVPRVRIDILLPPEQVERVLEAVCARSAGVAGHGIFWVSPVDRFGQF